MSWRSPKTTKTISDAIDWDATLEELAEEWDI